MPWLLLFIGSTITARSCAFIDFVLGELEHSPPLAGTGDAL
ncbi:hypothetical protein SynMINOS11_00567 [Synechococcus sp. Minos11]|nr:hypothetical protein SynMINOS11_00567 [Synechococcus sp. Minos11]